ncbi:hypothetical protein CBR_g18847, partial [Chara braunii]
VWSVIFVDAKKRHRVLGVILWWEDAKGSRRRFYIKTVYPGKGNFVANSKGALLDMNLFEGFGAGVVNTPFYNNLLQQGGFVLARQFFNLLEEKDVGLDIPCDVGPAQELPMPLQLCVGCESSGAASEGGDLGSGAASQLHRGESRGQFDDSENEATPLMTSSPLSRRDRSMLSIPGARQAALVREEVVVAPGKAAVHSDVELETAEGHGTEDETVGGEGMQSTLQKRRGDHQHDVVGSSKK